MAETTEKTPKVDYRELGRRAYWNRYGLTTEHKNFMGQPMPDFEVLPETIQRAWGNAVDLPVEDINALLQLKESWDRNHISDGYHTFDELYMHRHTLFASVGKLIAQTGKYNGVLPVWRSEQHADGSMFTGYFIAGIGLTPGNMATYHIPLDWWDRFSYANTLEKAPEWDGHTSHDTLKWFHKNI